METGSSSEILDKGKVMRGGNSKKKQDSNGIKIEPFVPRRDHNPKELKTWAKKTGFVSDYSGEAGTIASENFDSVVVDDHREGGSSPKIEIDPVLGVARPNRDDEIELDFESKHGVRRSEKDRFLRSNYALNGIVGNQNQRRKNGVEPVLDYGDKKIDLRGNGDGDTNGVVNLIKDSDGHGLGVAAVAPMPEKKMEEEGLSEDVKVNLYAEGEEHVDREWQRPSGMKYGLTENPGLETPVSTLTLSRQQRKIYFNPYAMLALALIPLIYYGLQHYLSLIGSLVLIPLVMVPVMGGTDNDTANVISTMLFLSGVTTILHSYLGTRLPLVHGSSFVYLAPALVIINSEEFRNLNHHKFRHIMRELQGAIIVGSIFQCILGLSGLMSLLLRIINPIVVAPTVAAVGLAFFSYGFPQAGTCMEISIPQIVLVLIFTLHLRGISIFGNHLFRIYAEILAFTQLEHRCPLSRSNSGIRIVIIFAMLKTKMIVHFIITGGAYNYKGCNQNIPSSNILIDACKKHAYTMKHCRTDVSNALSTSSWLRFPYPLQWGFPIFHFRTCIIMVIVSLVASVDSLSVTDKASIAVVKDIKDLMPQSLLKLQTTFIRPLSSMCKITFKPSNEFVTGIFIFQVGTYHSASLRINLRPPTTGVVSRGIALEGFCSILAGLWGSGTGSTTLTENVHTIDITKVASRRVVELGAAFMILFSFMGKVGALLASIPQALSASLDFAINALMSLNMVVTLLVAIVLENTVPRSSEERATYTWMPPQDIAMDPSLTSAYSLPRKVARCFWWARWLGV
ncbi:hypothetical protein TSUD_190830 [Trifolium subterraneum]|uniref:Uncharacterized protein n=1 Tax=Trifolium subterraneum TaxID=3900 RepID=A0A2Z6NQH2_TRISU|nr:hypothetical protein TSUD_190830 [Trifolium subterraneum]